ncbi:MAG: sigma-70 family RNA polymerase sigma factor [Phycisphaeraceae bacterium]|nr:sigma-70 family RNA polymerase sigma factor [Phycisphaeraceae bacterium]
MSNGLSKARELKLIRQAASGDADAATTLIKLHQRSVYGYILRISGQREVAEDVTQEAFTRVLVHIDRFDPRFRFSTWLFTIARRVYLNICEKRRPVLNEDRINAQACRHADFASEVDAQDGRLATRDLLDRALMRLPRDQREVMVLFYQHEWSIMQIADQMGLPAGTVKSHLHRGRARLRDEYLKLEQEGAPRQGAPEARGAKQEVLT